MIAYLLNLADYLFTLYALSLGVEECNPLMRNVLVMTFYKIVVVGLLLLWLSGRTEKIARIGKSIIVLIYGAINIYHILALLFIQN